MDGDGGGAGAGAEEAEARWKVERLIIMFVVHASLLLNLPNRSCKF